MTTPRTALAYYLTYNFPPKEITHHTASSVPHYLTLLSITVRACCAKHCTFTDTKLYTHPHRHYISEHRLHPTDLTLPSSPYISIVRTLHYFTSTTTSAFSYPPIQYFSWLYYHLRSSPLNHFVQVIISLITPITNVSHR